MWLSAFSWSIAMCSFQIVLDEVLLAYSIEQRKFKGFFCLKYIV